MATGDRVGRFSEEDTYLWEIVRHAGTRAEVM